LKKRVDELCFVKHNIPILFHLYKAEFAINNHEGKYTEAFCSFEKCKEVAQYINVEEYLELRNMYSVSLCDSGDFHKAKEETEKTLSYEELLVEIKKEVFSENDKVFIHYGRTQSQLGQCYAFAGEYEKAIGLFKNAIKSFGEDKNDINQTLSYLLHAAIEANNISVYEEYSGQYFGTKNRREQLLEILSEDNIANSFALYVYIKAYYMLYMTSCDRKETLDILREVERCKKNKENKNHPWEMIYKYVAFCCLKIGNKEYNDKADKYISLAKIETDQGILKKIIDEIDVQYKSLLAGKDAFENSELMYMYR
jgi:tetratricopeptide (TPR) repeat protein